MKQTLMGMKEALVLVEFQNDYYPNGRAPLMHSLEASQHTQKVLRHFRDHALPVIHVQQISTHPTADHFLPSTNGAKFHTGLEPIKNELVIKKHYPNAFKDTYLLNHLKKQGIKHLIICGMTTQHAIDATVRAARDLGFVCTILADCCAGKELSIEHRTVSATDVNLTFLAALQSTYAKISSTQDYLQSMQEDSLPMTG